MVSFVFPIFSNIGLLPLTGQSIPFLSTSWVEVLLFCIILLLIENFFGNPTQFIEGKEVLNFADLKNKHKHLMFLLGVGSTILLSIFFIKAARVNNYISWNKPEATLRQQAFPIRNKENNLVFSDSVKLYWLNECCKRISNNSLTNYEGQSNKFEANRFKFVDQCNVDYFIQNLPILVSGFDAPFGKVYANFQQVNRVKEINFSNPFYQNMLFAQNNLFNADLHAVCNQKLKNHLQKIGNKNNQGAVLIVDNNSGQIISCASFPASNLFNIKDKNFPVGSVKKPLLAFIALQIDDDYQFKMVNGCDFKTFIRKSNGDYAAWLLRDLLKNHPKEFENYLLQFFDMSILPDNYHTALLDEMPNEEAFEINLDKFNPLYRLAIGRQQPYSLHEMVEMFGRMITKEG
ncbi:MAG: hypothetical protein IPQ19_14215 [Bacteroidetes bacterium]|nr:hypothetical protein [Bacteroidota bacterium]